jgi:hypothetical protein
MAGLIALDNPEDSKSSTLETASAAAAAMEVSSQPI